MAICPARAALDVAAGARLVRLRRGGDAGDGGDGWRQREGAGGGLVRELRDRIWPRSRRWRRRRARAVEGLPAGRFERSETRRAGEDAGGGVMAVMRGGRVFEKVGVNVSTVHGRLGAAAQRSLTARRESRGWRRTRGSGPRGSASSRTALPRTPAVHLNTRMFWTPAAWWFGGGSDLNPMLEYAADTAPFHAALKAACDATTGLLPALQGVGGRVFLDPPPGRGARGGGQLLRRPCSGDWEADFAFTQDVGRAFLAAFVPIMERHMGEPWTEAERETQLVQRGLYAEFNLVYDRGTQFGLATGHDPEAVLMCLPPVAKWP